MGQLLDHLAEPSLLSCTYWGCTPESQKLPSAQLQSRHERIQVDELAVSLEGVMPVQQDVPPGRWRHLRDQRQRLGIASCLVLRQQQIGRASCRERVCQYV